MKWSLKELILTQQLLFFSIGNKLLRVKNKKGRITIKATYKDLVEKYQYMIYSHSFLTEVREDYIALGDFTEIKNGLATLQDKVFVINENEIINKSNKLLSFKKIISNFQSKLKG